MFALHLSLYELQLHNLEKLFPTINRGREQCLASEIVWRRQRGWISQLWIKGYPAGHRPGWGRADVEKVIRQFQAPAARGKASIKCRAAPTFAPFWGCKTSPGHSVPALCSSTHSSSTQQELQEQGTSFDKEFEWESGCYSNYHYSLFSSFFLSLQPVKITLSISSISWCPQEKELHPLNSGPQVSIRNWKEITGAACRKEQALKTLKLES